MKTAGAGSRLTRFLSLSYGLIPGLFLLNFIYPSSWVQGALAALTTATLAATLVALKNIFAPISAILLLLGAWNLWQQGLPFQDWLGAVIGKVDLFCLLLVLRFFEFPIQLGNYNYHVTDFALRKVKTGRQFFVLSTLVTYIFSIASDYASFQIIFSTLKERCRELIPSPERFLTAVIKRSVGLSQMISPVCPTLALVLTLSGITWIDYAPYGALVSGTGLLLSLVSACYLSPAFRNLRDLKFEPGSGAAGEKPQRRRVVQFFAIMIAIIVLIVLLDLKTGLNMLQVLFLVSLIVPPLWSLLIGRPREFGQKISRFFTRDAADFSTIFALVISAGFLSGTLGTGTVSILAAFASRRNVAGGGHHSPDGDPPDPAGDKRLHRGGHRGRRRRPSAPGDPSGRPGAGLDQRGGHRQYCIALLRLQPDHVQPYR